MATGTDLSRVEAGEPYEIIYYTSMPGRAEFARLLFVESQTPFRDLAQDDPSSAMDAVMAIASADSSDILGPNPAYFAPPLLRHGDLLINQVSNILIYLAPRLGLAPKEDGPARNHLNSIVQTILDGFSDEVHETHHPVGPMLYYEDQKPEAKRRAESYTSERLPKYLAWAQRVLSSPTHGSGPWLYGDSLTYADLVLFQVCRESELVLVSPSTSC
jgi:glutathione S-transferase